MPRLIAALVLMTMAGAAAAFPVDLEVDAGELRIGTIVHSDGHIAVVRVTNDEDVTVRCDAVFRNGPEVGRERNAIIEPSASAALSWTPRREVVRLRIELTCQRHEAADD
jgi:hypothetical protein